MSYLRQVATFVAWTTFGWALMAILVINASGGNPIPTDWLIILVVYQGIGSLYGSFGYQYTSRVTTSGKLVRALFTGMLLTAMSVATLTAVRLSFDSFLSLSLHIEGFLLPLWFPGQMFYKSLTRESREKAHSLATIVPLIPVGVVVFVVVVIIWAQMYSLETQMMMGR